MVGHEEANVIRYALVSRLGIFVLQIVFNLLVVDHQPSGVFEPPDVSSRTGLGDTVIEVALAGFRRWDSIYMIHIAEHGYIYEHTMAFFPIFPLTVRLVGFTILYPLQHVMSLRHLMMLSAFLLNSVCFVLAALYLHSLAAILMGKGHQGKRGAWICAMLFCFNPASIFMSAAYTECTFALLSFAVMYYMERKLYMKATVALALSCGTRSNGLVLVGYPLYHLLKLTISPTSLSSGSCIHLIRDWFKLASCCMYGAIPFVIYQYMGFAVYCRGSKRVINDQLVQYGRSKGYHIPNDSPSEWCYYSIPFPYGYIQQFYWNVSPFAYYQWKQIPNFLLASPVVLLSLYTVYTFARICMKSLVHCGYNLRSWLSSNSTRMLPYTLHLTFLLFYGLANAHVQILTRMIYSSSPLIYICIATQLARAVTWRDSTFVSKFTLIYSLSYFVIGTAVHSNFFPWT